MRQVAMLVLLLCGAEAGVEVEAAAAAAPAHELPPPAEVTRLEGGEAGAEAAEEEEAAAAVADATPFHGDPVLAGCNAACHRLSAALAVLSDPAQRAAHVEESRRGAVPPGPWVADAMRELEAEQQRRRQACEHVAVVGLQEAVREALPRWLLRRASVRAPQPSPRPRPL